MADEIFDKTSEPIAKLVNKTLLCRYPRCRYLIYNNGSEFRLLQIPVNHMVFRVSQPRLRILERTAYWNMYIKS